MFHTLPSRETHSPVAAITPATLHPKLVHPEPPPPIRDVCLNSKQKTSVTTPRRDKCITGPKKKKTTKTRYLHPAPVSPMTPNSKKGAPPPQPKQKRRQQRRRQKRDATPSTLTPPPPAPPGPATPSRRRLCCRSGRGPDTRCARSRRRRVRKGSTGPRASRRSHARRWRCQGRP
jgi:hypothetical protein